MRTAFLALLAAPAALAAPAPVEEKPAVAQKAEASVKRELYTDRQGFKFTKEPDQTSGLPCSNWCSESPGNNCGNYYCSGCNTCAAWGQGDKFCEAWCETKENVRNSAPLERDACAPSGLCSYCLATHSPPPPSRKHCQVPTPPPYCPYSRRTLPIIPASQCKRHAGVATYKDNAASCSGCNFCGGSLYPGNKKVPVPMCTRAVWDIHEDDAYGYVKELGCKATWNEACPGKTAPLIAGSTTARITPTAELASTSTLIQAECDRLAAAAGR